MGVDAAVEAAFGHAVQPVDQLGAAESLSWVLGQHGEQVEFDPCQADSFATAADAVTVEIDFEVADVEQIGRLHFALGTTQDGTHTRHQFTRRKGLDDVVVCAQFEADETVGLVGTGGEHDDGHTRFAAQRPTDVEAVHARQIEIKDDKIGLVRPGGGEGGVAVHGREDAETAAFQVVARQADDFGFVVDNEDEFVHWSKECWDDEMMR